MHASGGVAHTDARGTRGQPVQEARNRRDSGTRCAARRAHAPTTRSCGCRLCGAHGGRAPGRQPLQRRPRRATGIATSWTRGHAHQSRRRSTIPTWRPCASKRWFVAVCCCVEPDARRASVRWAVARALILRFSLIWKCRASARVSVVPREPVRTHSCHHSGARKRCSVVPWCPTPLLHSS